MEKTYERNCPECDSKIIYTNYNTFYMAKKNNSKCKECEKIRKTNLRKGKTMIEIYGEERGKELIEKNRIGHLNQKMSEENLKKMIQYHTGRPRTEETKEKIRIANTGKKHSEETKKKLSEIHKGKKFSDETRKKQRISSIKRIVECKGQCYPNFNPSGCDILNNIMIDQNTYIQHAMNGGEFYIKELGYWVDGYDKENNIVYEIDEKHHFDQNGCLYEKDIIRQKEIVEHLNCEFIRIKYEKKTT